MARRKVLVAMRFSQSCLAKLDSIAEQKDMSRSELVRLIVDNYVQMHT